METAHEFGARGCNFRRVRCAHQLRIISKYFFRKYAHFGAHSAPYMTIQTTMIYAHLIPEHMMAAVEKISCF